MYVSCMYCRICKISFNVKFNSNLEKQGHSSLKISSGHQKESTDNFGFLAFQTVILI